jgi:RNA polymerase sigma-70 factor (ECF subfamily)
MVFNLQMMTTEQIKQWYAVYGPMVFRRCRQLLTDEAAAKDAVQEVFVHLLQKSSHIRDEFPSTFLYRVATNVSLNIIRSRKRKKEIDSAETVLETIACEKDEINEISARTVLNRLFSREPDSTRVIATYHFVDGLTLEETALEVGMSVSGVRKRLRQLKERFQQSGVMAEAL